MIFVVGQYVRERGYLWLSKRGGNRELFLSVGIKIGRERDVIEWCFAFLSLSFFFIRWETSAKTCFARLMLLLSDSVRVLLCLMCMTLYFRTEGITIWVSLLYTSALHLHLRLLHPTPLFWSKGSTSSPGAIATSASPSPPLIGRSTEIYHCRRWMRTSSWGEPMLASPPFTFTVINRIGINPCLWGAWWNSKKAEEED
jgi:hypothetical protein